MKRKLLSILLALSMALTLLPMTALAAEGKPLPPEADPAQWDTIELTKADGTELTEDTDYTVTNGTYYHYAYSERFKYHKYTVTTSDPIVISGGAEYKNNDLTNPLKSYIALGPDVTSVTLKDVTKLGELSITEGSNVTFTLEGNNNVDRILGVGATTSMTFEGNGSLTGKHIGGINKYDVDPATNISCNITINGGIFDLTASYESAIGGGQYGNAGKITINGGKITAKSNYGAAIGGGQKGSATDIVITDGEINATGSFGAAIGGGQNGNAEKISISGGDITARGSHVGAAIGGGQDGNVGTVEITDGTINAIARKMAIGGKNAGTISISGGDLTLGKLNSSSQPVDPDPGQIGAASGGTVAEIKISGGSCNIQFPEEYYETGYKPKDDGNGKYTVEENFAAEIINGTKYLTLAAAIEAAQEGDTIKLLADVDAAAYTEIRKPLTIDFNTYKLTSSDGGFDVYADLTLKNGTLESVKWGAWVQSGAKLLVDSDMIINATSADDNKGGITVQNSGSEITIKGTVTAAGGAAISGIGNDGDGGVTINIEDGAVIENTNENGVGIYYPNTAELNIKGGAITGATGVYVKSGKTTITGGTITGNGTAADYSYNGNGCTPTGDALVVDACNYPGGNPTVEIKGGSFTGTKSAIGYYQHSGSDPLAEQGTATISITGGTFNSNPNDYVNATSIVKRDGSEGSYTYTVLAKSNLGPGVYLSDPTGALASNCYVSSSDGTTWTVSRYSSDGGSSSGSTTTKTETTTNPDGSTTKTETKSDGTTVETTTGKDGSTTKTETKKDGSSVTESKDASGSTGTVKTDKDGKAEAETKLSSKAVEDAKKNDEAVKAPVEVEAGKDSVSAPTVKIDLPSSAGETKVEIPVSNVSSGTVAVIVKPDGTEEIVKTSVPTENGVILSVEGGATVKIIDNSKDFIDTRDHWSREEVNFVASRELFNGVGDNLFGVSGEMTRGMVNTVLARLAGADTTGGSIWYEKGTEWAKANGISDGTNPEASVTREQLATMLYRFAGSPAVSGELSFADADRISGYAQNAMLWAVQNGILNGIGDNLIAPQNSAERAQVAAMMARYIKNAI